MRARRYYILSVFAAPPRLPRLVRRLAGLSVVLLLAACAAAVAADPSNSAATCPRKLPIASSGPAASQNLVPKGASRVLLCRYRFTSLKGHGLITQASEVRTLTQEFDALRAMPNGTYSCPADFGVDVSALFKYRGAAADQVVADEGGCTIVWNGQLKRWAYYPPGPKLLRQLLTDSGCRSERSGSDCA